MNESYKLEIHYNTYLPTGNKKAMETSKPKIFLKKLKSVGMTVAKVKEQDGMTLAKVKEQDGMTLAKVKEQDGMMLAKVKEQDGTTLAKVKEQDDCSK